MDHPPEICALGRDNNGSAFAIFFEEVSEFEACLEVGCITPATFRVEHTSREVCEDAIDGVQTCVASVNFFGLSQVSHCILPIHWDDPFPIRQTFTELEHCGIETIPILELLTFAMFYPFQQASDCGHLSKGLPIPFPTPAGYQSPFDMEIGICNVIFITNFTFRTQWCGIPNTIMYASFGPRCIPGAITEDTIVRQFYFLSKNECSSVKALEIAYRFRLEGDPDVMWR